MPFYAEVDENGIVKHVAEGPIKPSGARFYTLSSFDVSLLGKKRESGKFVEVVKSKADYQAERDALAARVSELDTIISGL